MPTSSVLSSLKSAADIAKLFNESEVSLEKAEFKLKHAELIELLAEAKLGVSEIQNILAEKADEIRSLKFALEVKDTVIYEGRYYWKVQDEGKDGPFCQRCYDVDSKLIRLQLHEYDDRGSISRWHKCKACNTLYDA